MNNYSCKKIGKAGKIGENGAAGMDRSADLRLSPSSILVLVVKLLTLYQPPAFDVSDRSVAGLWVTVRGVYKSRLVC